MASNPVTSVVTCDMLGLPAQIRKGQPIDATSSAFSFSVEHLEEYLGLLRMRG